MTMRKAGAALQYQFVDVLFSSSPTINAPDRRKYPATATTRPGKPNQGPREEVKSINFSPVGYGIPQFTGVLWWKVQLPAGWKTVHKTAYRVVSAT